MLVATTLHSLSLLSAGRMGKGDRMAQSVGGLLQVNCVARLVSTLNAMREEAGRGGSSGAVRSEEEKRGSGKQAAQRGGKNRLVAND